MRPAPPASRVRGGCRRRPPTRHRPPRSHSARTAAAPSACAPAPLPPPKVAPSPRRRRARSAVSAWTLLEGNACRHPERWVEKVAKAALPGAVAVCADLVLERRPSCRSSAPAGRRTPKNEPQARGPPEQAQTPRSASLERPPCAKSPMRAEEPGVAGRGQGARRESRRGRGCTRRSSASRTARVGRDGALAGEEPLDAPSRGESPQRGFATRPPVTGRGSHGHLPREDAGVLSAEAEQFAQHTRRRWAFCGFSPTTSNVARGVALLVMGRAWEWEAVLEWRAGTPQSSTAPAAAIRWPAAPLMELTEKRASVCAPKKVLYRLGFGQVVQQRSVAMRVEVVRPAKGQPLRVGAPAPWRGAAADPSGFRAVTR